MKNGLGRNVNETVFRYIKAYYLGSQQYRFSRLKC